MATNFLIFDNFFDKSRHQYIFVLHGECHIKMETNGSPQTEQRFFLLFACRRNSYGPGYRLRYLRKELLGGKAEPQDSQQQGLGRALLKKVFELGYAFLSPDTPAWAKAVIIGALGYFISPADAVPDLIPCVGYVDDAGVITSALTTIAMYVTDDVKAKAEKAVEGLLG